MFHFVSLRSIARKAIVTFAMLSLTSTGFSGGGSGGGSAPGGGGGKTCSVISHLSVGTGPAPWSTQWAEVHVDYILKGCTPGFVPAGMVTLTNLNPNPWWSLVGYVSAQTNPIVAPFARMYFSGPNLTPFSANVRLDFVVTDPATGAVLDSQAMPLAAAPKP